MRIYKLRNKQDPSLFSTGSMEPEFSSTRGKIWKQLRHVKSHLAQFKGLYYKGPFKNYPNEVDIVEYEFSETRIIEQ